MRPTDECEYPGHTGALPVSMDPGLASMRRRRTDAGAATAVHLDFAVSQDEEHVRLTLLCGGAVCDLGERVHHYALLLLVRLRIQALHRGILADSAGWVACEDLARMLGLNVPHLYIQLFRLRRQIVAAAPAASPIVERRRGQLRAAGIGVRITQGSTVQVELLAVGPTAAG